MIRGKVLFLTVAAFVALAVMLAEESQAKRYDVHKKPYAPPPPAVHHRPSYPSRPHHGHHVAKPVPHRPSYPKRRHHRQADYYDDSGSDEADEDSGEVDNSYDEK